MQFSVKKFIITDNIYSELGIMVIVCIEQLAFFLKVQYSRSNTKADF